MTPQDAAHARRNAELWAACAPVPRDSLAGEYLRRRGIRSWPLPDAVRWHPALAPFSAADDDGQAHEVLPDEAIVAPVTRHDGSMVALQRLWVHRRSSDGRPLGRPRLLTPPSGYLRGAAIVLGAAQDGVLGFATDIETALLASERSGIPTFSAASPKPWAVAAWQWPADVRNIAVFDPDGPDIRHRDELRAAVRELVRRASDAGIRCELSGPPAAAPSRPPAHRRVAA